MAVSLANTWSPCAWRTRSSSPWPAKFSQGLDRRFTLVRRAVVDCRNREHACTTRFGRKVIRIGDRRELDDAAELFGSGRHEVAPRSDNRLCVRFRIERCAEHQL